MKPEVIAPGYKIKSSCSASSRDSRANNKLTSKSGSSMAAPYVASLIVKILEKEPRVTHYNTVPKNNKNSENSNNMIDKKPSKAQKHHK